jgi:hypothetical protein
MAIRVEIDCINKDDRFNPYEAITHVGGPNPPGSANPRWKLKMREAAEGSRDGKWSFYVKQNGHIVDVHHAESKFGNLYLRTQADRDTPDNLLHLAECR